MAAKSPAFRFYAQDFLNGSQTLTLAERGAYITLLCYQWDKGKVPETIREISQVLGCSTKQGESIWLHLAHKFPKDKRGRRKNKRMEAERRKQQSFSKVQSIKGKLGGKGRSRGLAPANPGQAPVSLSSSFSSSYKKSTKAAPAAGTHLSDALPTAATEVFMAAKIRKEQEEVEARAFNSPEAVAQRKEFLANCAKAAKVFPKVGRA